MLVGGHGAVLSGVTHNTPAAEHKPVTSLLNRKIQRGFVVVVVLTGDSMCCYTLLMQVHIFYGNSYS